MEDILNQLKQSEIISPSTVYKLQQTIKEQHPHASSKECALLFAKSVHQMIDHALFPFEPTEKIAIKKVVLSEAVLRGSFSISALDIWQVCISLNLTKDKPLDALMYFVNMYHPTPLSTKSVKQLIKLTPTILIPPTQLTSSSTTHSPHAHTLFPKLHAPYISITLLIIFILAMTFSLCHLLNVQKTKQVATLQAALIPEQLTTSKLPLHISLYEQLPYLDSHLQPHLQYKAIDEEALIHFLDDRDSLLSEEPYFSELLETAKTFNINALLLFAITGQEQGFVPRDHQKAKAIVNNPFNVYGSWQTYNTSIEDSSRIAAKTILNLSKGCPQDEDPIKWLNQSYAEDPNWHKGVSKLFYQLEEVTKLPEE